MRDIGSTEREVIEHWRCRWEGMRLADGPAAPNERRLVQIIEDNWGPMVDLDVLEVGCGQGRISVAFAEAGASPVCLDSAYRAVLHSVARHRRLGLKAKGLVASGFGLPLRDHSVDVVISGGLLEHFEYDLRVEMLREMRRVCRGCVVAMIPNGMDPFYRFAKWCLQETDRWPWGEEHSLRGLKEEYQEAGMVVVHESSFDFYNSTQLFRDALALTVEQAQALMKWSTSEVADDIWCGYRLVTVGEPE